MPNTDILLQVRRLSATKYEFPHFLCFNDLLKCCFGYIANMKKFEIVQLTVAHVTYITFLFYFPVISLWMKCIAEHNPSKLRRPCCYAHPSVRTFLYEADFKLRSWRENAFISLDRSIHLWQGWTIILTRGPESLPE